MIIPILWNARKVTHNAVIFMHARCGTTLEGLRKSLFIIIHLGNLSRGQGSHHRCGASHLCQLLDHCRRVIQVGHHRGGRRSRHRSWHCGIRKCRSCRQVLRRLQNLKLWGHCLKNLKHQRENRKVACQQPAARDLWLLHIVCSVKGWTSPAAIMTSLFGHAAGRCHHKTSAMRNS